MTPTLLNRMDSSPQNIPGLQLCAWMFHPDPRELQANLK